MSINSIASKVAHPIVSVSVFLLCVLTFLYIDRPLAIYFHRLNLADVVPILLWITNIGLGAVYLVVLISAGFIFRYVLNNAVWEARMWFLTLCISWSAGWCILLKILLGRARPSMWFEFHQWGFYGLQSQSTYWSLPSGHTTNVMALALGLGIIFPKHARALISIGLVVACSRVLLTFHYLTDVISAVYLTILEISLLYFYLKKKGFLLAAFALQHEPRA